MTCCSNPGCGGNEKRTLVPVGLVSLECSPGTKSRIAVHNDNPGPDQNGTHSGEPGHQVIWGIFNLFSRFSCSEFCECQEVY